MREIWRDAGSVSQPIRLITHGIRDSAIGGDRERRRARHRISQGCETAEDVLEFVRMDPLTIGTTEQRA